MTQRIYMYVPQMKRLSQQLASIVDSIHSLSQELQTAANGDLPWEGPSAREFLEQLRQLLATWKEKLPEAQDLLEDLQREIQEWERASADLESTAVGVGSAAVGAAAGGAATVTISAGASRQQQDTTPPPSSQKGDGQGNAPPVEGGSSAAGYTPHFDGKTPAPETTSTYGKPGQWPLKNVPVTSDPSNRDPNRYQDVINQFAVGNNPRYAPIVRPGPHNDITFCNTFAGDVARAMGHPFPTKAQWGINPRDPATIGMPDVWRYFTDPRAPIRAADQGWKEITITNLQELERYINSGKMAVVMTPDHIAVVRPNQHITNLADIRIAQAGATNSNDLPLVRGFGKKRLGIIRIFVHD